MEEEEERSEEGEGEDSVHDCPGLVVGCEDREEMQEEDKEEEEEVTMVKGVKKDQEVEMVEETAVGKKEEKEAGGAVGPMGSADFCTTKERRDYWKKRAEAAEARIKEGKDQLPEITAQERHPGQGCAYLQYVWKII